MRSLVSGTGEGGADEGDHGARRKRPLREGPRGRVARDLGLADPRSARRPLRLLRSTPGTRPPFSPREGDATHPPLAGGATAAAPRAGESLNARQAKTKKTKSENGQRAAPKCVTCTARKTNGSAESAALAPGKRAARAALGSAPPSPAPAPSAAATAAAAAAVPLGTPRRAAPLGGRRRGEGPRSPPPQPAREAPQPGVYSPPPPPPPCLSLLATSAAQPATH